MITAPEPDILELSLIQIKNRAVKLRSYHEQASRAAEDLERIATEVARSHPPGTKLRTYLNGTPERPPLPQGWQLEYIGVKLRKNTSPSVVQALISFPQRPGPEFWPWLGGEMRARRVIRPCPFCNAVLADCTKGSRMALMCSCGFSADCRVVRGAQPTMLLE